MTIARSKEPKEFAAFEHEGWEKASGAYARLIAPTTRQSVPATLDAAKVAKGMRVLDVCTGPGILAQGAAERGAEAMGLEGIVSKRLDAPYVSGPGCGWIKVSIISNYFLPYSSFE